MPTVLSAYSAIVMYSSNVIIEYLPVLKKLHFIRTEHWEISSFVILTRENLKYVPLYCWSLKLNLCFTFKDLSSSRVKSTAIEKMKQNKIWLFRIYRYEMNIGYICTIYLGNPLAWANVNNRNRIHVWAEAEILWNRDW